MVAALSGVQSAIMMLVMLLLLLDVSPALGVCLDQSTQADCSGAEEFPPPGERVCYVRSISSDGVCTLAERPKTRNNIVEREFLFKIASPRFYVNRPYQRRRLCQYNVPSCPSNRLTHIEWNRGNFVLQPICEFGPTPERICSDHVEFIDINLLTEATIAHNDNMGGLIVDDNGLLCGSQPDFSMRFASRPIRVNFRSDAGERFKGFLIDIMCTELEFQFRETNFQINLSHRVRRDALMNIHVRGKRMAVYPPRMTPENCTMMGGFLPPTFPSNPAPIPQIGSRLQVPRGAFLTFQDEIVNVIQSGKVLRTFPDIPRLFFWTGFNGTRVFNWSASVPSDEIFGGGRLFIEKRCAYYVNFLSPPRYEPACRELDVISFILNATNPFFEDQDIVDDDDNDELVTAPQAATISIPIQPPVQMSPRRQRLRGPNRGKRDSTTHNLKEEEKHVWKRYSRRSTPPPRAPELDPRIDPQALKLALEFENACNPYLRQASRSFLDILQQEVLLGQDQSRRVTR